jgi:hypothetical protein
MLTQAELKRVLRYDPETGEFFWLAPERRTELTGQLAGYTDDRGYVWIRLADDKLYLAHRLAFLYMLGYMPEMVDHKRGMSNKWSNLRPANKSTNAINSKLRFDNKTGSRGVTFLGRGRKQWQARIKIPAGYVGKTFYTKEEAVDWYNQQAAKFHGEFRYSGPPASALPSLRESPQISPLLGFDITLLGLCPVWQCAPSQSLGNSNASSDERSLNWVF